MIIKKASSTSKKWLSAIVYCLLITVHCSLITDRPAYRLYNSSGRAISYQKLLRQAAEADVVLFGELHNNPICHWLELQLTKDLYALKKEQLVLAAEMFETDNQAALTGYVTGQLTDKEFAKQARLWPNYNTDYKPIVDFCRTNKIPFIAANVPRKYASLVARQGLAALDTVANKTLLPPLPLTVDLTLPGYAAMLDMMGGNHGGGGEAANFARAQAIKDATMAHSIAQNWSAGKLVLHINGDYHSKNFEGISWYLKRERPDLRVFTISSIELDDVSALPKESRTLANIMLAIPTDMTKTY
jgi:uncharacterized iron-regulated protein